MTQLANLHRLVGEGLLFVGRLCALFFVRGFLVDRRECDGVRSLTVHAALTLTLRRLHVVFVVDLGAFVWVHKRSIEQAHGVAARAMWRRLGLLEARRYLIRQRTTDTAKAQTDLVRRLVTLGRHLAPESSRELHLSLVEGHAVGYRYLALEAVDYVLLASLVRCIKEPLLERLWPKYFDLLARILLLYI